MKSPKYQHLLQLLLGAQVVGVTALLLAAVDRTGVEAGIAPGEAQVKGQIMGYTLLRSILEAHRAGSKSSSYVRLSSSSCLLKTNCRTNL